MAGELSVYACDGERKTDIARLLYSSQDGLFFHRGGWGGIISVVIHAKR